jgi:hypothetical protein
MLEKVSGRKWGRLYLARPMMEVIEKPEEESGPGQTG